MASTANSPSNGTGSKTQSAKTTQQYTGYSPKLPITWTIITIHYNKHATLALTTHTTSIALSPILRLSLFP